MESTRVDLRIEWRDWLDVRHGPSEAAGLDVSDITQIDPNAEPWWGRYGSRDL
jgi:hypothetical protein